MNKVDYNTKLEKIVERLEKFPCCMSCYLTIPEMKAAQNMKNNMIKIIKESLVE